MRVSNWTNILTAKVEEWRNRPFRFGDADCWQFCADVVLAITGTDHRGAFPTYASKEEAEAILATYGGMIGLATAVLGEPKSAKRAQRGDVVIGDIGDGPAAGICIGVMSCWIGARGLVFAPTLRATAAWSI